MDFFVIVFMFAWAVGVASWFLGIAEMIAIAKFSPWAFSTGIKVMAREVSLPEKLDCKDEILELDNASAKIVTGSTIYFRQGMGMFSLRIRTPCPISGVIRKENGVWSMEGRIPISTVSFFVAWLIGWTSGGVTAITKSGVEGGAFIILGWAFVAVMVMVSLPLEKRRAKRTIDDLVTRLNGSV